MELGNSVVRSGGEGPDPVETAAPASRGGDGAGAEQPSGRRGASSTDSEAGSDSEGETAPWRRYAAATVHPLLLALFPVVFLYTRNIVILEPGVLPAPALLFGGAALGLTVALFALLRRPEQTSLAVSASIVLLFVSDVVFERFIEPRLTVVDPFPWRLGWWLALCVAAALLIAFAAGSGRLVTAMANRAALVLFALPFIANGAQIRAIARPDPASPGVAAEFAGVSPEGGARARPDIYVIIADEYGREDTLRRLYGVDNRPFLDALRQRKFTIAAGSHSNYSMTIPAVASLFNFDYVHNLIDEPWTWRGQQDLIRGARLFPALAGQGYRPLLLSVGDSRVETLLPGLRFGGEAPGFLQFGDFFAELLALTPFGTDRWRDELSGRSEVVDALAAPDTLRAIATLPEPTFTFVHFLAPHEPFYFNAEGGARPRSIRVNWARRASNYERWRGLYAEEVAGVNVHLLRVVDALLESAGEAPVILLMGDHGPRPQGYALDFRTAADHVFGKTRALPAWSRHEGDFLDEWMAILMAAHLPGRADALPAAISPVNALRLVLSEYAGLDLAPIEDRSFIARPPAKPSGRFHFLDVTAELSGPPP